MRRLRSADLRSGVLDHAASLVTSEKVPLDHCVEKGEPDGGTSKRDRVSSVTHEGLQRCRTAGISMLRVSQAADMTRRMADATQDPELGKFHALGAVMDRTTIIIILLIVLVLGGWLVRHGRSF
jgi:hypothetical protein